MHGEPEDLIEARALLGKFEAAMGHPDSIGDLTSGLSLLAYVRANASTEFGQVATNLAIAYAKRTQVVVESLLAREPSLHGDTVNYWQAVLTAFLQYELAFPPEVAETRSKLIMRKMNREIKLLSPEERQRLIALLQGANNK